MPFPFQPVPVNSPQPGIFRMQRRIDHLVHGFMEAVLFKSHALGQSAKHLDVGTALAQRFDGRVRHLQIVVPVCALQILVLEERGRRKHNVGVVDGIGKELLMHDGEQVGTLQSSNDLVVIGTNRRRIRVVDKERFDRRIFQSVQRRAQVPPC